VTPPKTIATPARLALRPEEAAAALGMGRTAFDEYVAPELRWVRKGRVKLVAVRELEAFLERNAARTIEADDL
jgi:hypothetical protein